jgi:hypothetical protein
MCASTQTLSLTHSHIHVHEACSEVTETLCRNFYKRTLHMRGGRKSFNAANIFDS